MPRFITGQDDFKRLRNDGGYFVDKSLLIKDVLNGGVVALVPRPRRFGKTLNMSMLRYFFEKSSEDHAPLFKDLLIARDSQAMAHQGQYPVLHLSLKDIKGNDWEAAFDCLQETISSLYRTNRQVLETLEPVQQREFEALCDKSAKMSVLTLSLKNLVNALYHCHGKPVVVLIDEYDSPIIEAWQNGYYKEMIDFMRAWLGGGLKPENGAALFRGGVTGILRVAKESIFSGLNNLDVWTVISPGGFADKFGFTQPELDKALVDFNLPELTEPMREWYNGYSFGGCTIYNPWSVISCINRHPAPIGPQWLNTASNTLIHEELTAGGLELKRDLEKLLAGEELRYPINEYTVFTDIGKTCENIWSFLCFSGYLRAEDPQPNPLKRTQQLYRISIPNLEVAIAYEQFVTRWQTSLDFHNSKELLMALLDCNFTVLERLLSDLVRNLVSCHDVAHYPEAAYHALVLGLLADLRSIYQIRSNPESGYGRADLILQPKTPEYPLAFVIEFKSIDAGRSLDDTTLKAHTQMKEKGYAAQLQEAGILPEHIHNLAIVIKGKEVRVRELLPP